METAIGQSSVSFHVSLNVSDLRRSVEFYHKVFGANPSKERADYAKFELKNPPLTLSLEPAGAVGFGGALNHIGFRLASSTELVDLQQRLEMAGLASQREDGVECCYSRQTKFWLRDPDQTLWEFYVLEDDDECASDAARASTQPARPNHSPQPAATKTLPHPASPTTTGRNDWEHLLDREFPIPLPFDDESLTEVRLRGTFNVPIDAATREAMFAEVYRVLAPKGRVVLHQLTADRPLLDGVPSLPGPAAVVRDVPVDRDVLAWAEEAGFDQIRLIKFSSAPTFETDGVTLREMIVEARKPAEEVNADEVTVVYKGPFRNLIDDSGRVFRRGERVGIRAETWNVIQSGPLEEFFIRLDEEPKSSPPAVTGSLESAQCAEMLKAIGDPIRLRIIDALRTGAKNVGDLAELLHTEIATVSHHLGILHTAGLLKREKHGRFKVYRLREGILATTAEYQGKQHIDLGCCRLEIPVSER
jgi:DNA-binding transcriptional ArsR family regulator/catechol 2,3-dioxygenase-like lactoylglutathione lyase family enzyme